MIPLQLPVGAEHYITESPQTLASSAVNLVTTEYSSEDSSLGSFDPQNVDL